MANRWAFIPGWDKVRQLSWKAGTCDDDAIIAIIGQLARAKQPAQHATCNGLLP